MKARGLPTLALAAAGVITITIARGRGLRWGATAGEFALALPGDELMPVADITATRAITIAAEAAAVWPWIAQLGSGRGGFYSYDRLENLVGCDMHSAERIVPEWQGIAVGDTVKLHPQLPLDVAMLLPGRALVMRGGIPMGPVAAPYDFTWAFVLTQADGETRLLVRERYLHTRWWSRLLVEPVEVISLVMSRRMLRTIRERAQSAAAVGAAT